MSLLDVSDAFDIDVNLDTFSVQRRRQEVSVKGRTTTNITTFDDINGTVTAATPNDLERTPDADVSLKSIVIVTNFRLQLASPGFSNDIVLWGGDAFEVIHADDYSHYGPGFIQAIAQAITYPVQAPRP